MSGIRVRKDYWPRPGVLAWPDRFWRLDRILDPVAEIMDRCWWYLGGHTVTLPLDLPEDRKPTQADYEKALPEQGRQMDELRSYLDDEGTVGRPGFFSHGAAALSGDWRWYVAADVESKPVGLFSSLAGSVPDLLAPPAEQPQEVSLIAYGVDWAYWDIFLRDAWMLDLVREHLKDRPHLMVEAT